ncbi:hypothetical protein UA08_08018 [Talaromyces atroroseus]|uniref:Amine oxidase n=1 Tax=Talaromyces atroroseus TaxID=1441469 RepID=A0A225AP06_TALAT|nr:hypothetical protein UA08_08018 [Talaromyces atroroseus]OKL56696.1 hypothetical protein UA08_08018 [Talaromyces atroroseus]
MHARTSDAYSWTQENGLQKGGFECQGAIAPSTKIKVPGGFVYDVVVIGGEMQGYHSVLLLEGRDKIGGRTFSVDSNGFKYEMGGTWVSHYQPHTFSELRRYNLDKDLVATRQPGYENDYYTLNLQGEPSRKLSHKEASQIFTEAWNKFINVDGHLCRKICPLPYQQLGNIMVDRQEVKKVDQLSSWDRYEEIKHKLSPEGSGMLLSQLLMISGGDLKNSSLWDMIRSQALGGHDISNFEDIFDEAVQTGLDYSFKAAVTSVSNSRQNGQQLVEVGTQDGRTFPARRVICTVPLNVLKHIKFSPPLSAKRREAVDQGHIYFMTKIHAEVKGSGLASWQGTAYPSPLLFGFGDGLTPQGNTHITAFGGDERPHFLPERDVDKICEALQALHPMDIQRLVFHNWNTDPFSQAGPCWWPPEFMSKYQDELQSRHGNVFFASADWADGWRAFIDGAIEQGRKNAQEVAVELRAMKHQQSVL